MTAWLRRGCGKGLLAVLLATGVLGAGCQSVPPAPPDRYYRLLEVQVRDAAVRPWTAKGSIELRELRADGPYLERAILFTDGRSQHIEAYHYDHWIYPPPYLIQQHMLRWFREHHLAPTIVDDDRGALPAFVVSGRIVRFERTVGAEATGADVELELQVERTDSGGAPFRKTYRATESAAGSSMDAFVQCVSRALEAIYAQFSNDVTAVQR